MSTKSLQIATKRPQINAERSCTLSPRAAHRLARAGSPSGLGCTAPGVARLLAPPQTSPCRGLTARPGDSVVPEGFSSYGSSLSLGLRLYTTARGRRGRFAVFGLRGRDPRVTVDRAKSKKSKTTPTYCRTQKIYHQITAGPCKTTAHHCRTFIL